MTEQTPPLPMHEAPTSGAQMLLGYRIDLTDPAGGASVLLDLEAKHLNRNETLHGGIHTMLLDVAAGFAASRHLSGMDADLLVPVQTLSLTTNYISSATQGAVVAQGTVTGGGYKIVYATSELTDAAGRLLSSATGVFKRVTS